MKIIETVTERTYYVEDSASYKVVHRTWSPEPEWRKTHHPGTDGDWKVFASQGIHAYARQCDQTKATHHRVVKAVRELTNGESHGLEKLES